MEKKLIAQVESVSSNNLGGVEIIAPGLWTLYML